MEAGDVPRSDAERCEPVRRSVRGTCQRGLSRRHKRDTCGRTNTSVTAVEERSARLHGGLSGTCALVALASGLSIRPVLKHGPRSLTCVRVGGLGKPARRKEADWRDPLSGGAPPTDPDLL
jgi:hypothetical protein